MPTWHGSDESPMPTLIDSSLATSTFVIGEVAWASWLLPKVRLSTDCVELGASGISTSSSPSAQTFLASCAVWS